MINLYNQVPTVYSEASRDFQYLSWLINIVLNSVKHNIDDLYDLPKVDSSSKLAELFAFTLGFKIRRNYNKDQLFALVSILPELTKCKGTIKALELAGNALIRSSGALGQCRVNRDIKLLKEGIVELILPKDLVDVTLLNDLLPYILPAGMSYRISRNYIEYNDFETNVSYQTALVAKLYEEEIKLTDDNQISGVAGLFDNGPKSRLPIFTNFEHEQTTDNNLNAGLLDNTIIPIVDTKNTLRDSKV